MISDKLHGRITKEGEKKGFVIESMEYQAYERDRKARFVITLACTHPVSKAEDNQLTEFDVLTCDGFDELFELVKIRNIDLDDDVVVILFRRLAEQYPRGSWDFRNATEKVVGLIRERELAKGD